MHTVKDRLTDFYRFWPVSQSVTFSANQGHLEVVIESNFVTT